MRNAFILLLLPLLFSCNSSRSPAINSFYSPANEVPLIHPLAFEKVTCWLSDTNEPVYTQFSIDAINENRNEYDYSMVKTVNGFVTYVEIKENISISYRKEKLKNNHLLIHLYSNYGGRSTFYCGIEGRIIKKQISKYGKKQSILIFDVLGIHKK